MSTIARSAPPIFPFTILPGDSTSRLAMALGILVGVTTWGCSRSDDSTESLEVGLVEPKQADVSDREAGEQFLQSLQRGEKTDSHDGQSDGEHSSAWPQLFGPHQNNVAPESNVNLVFSPEGPRSLWELEMGTGYGSPIVAEDRVVATHRIDPVDTDAASDQAEEVGEEVIVCVDLHDGEVIWEHRYPTTLVCDNEYSNGPYATPVIHDGHVYSFGGQGKLHCLSLEQGDVVWSRDLFEEFAMQPEIFPAGGSPIVQDGRLFLALGAGDLDAGIVALDAKTGKTLWTATDHGPGYTSPFTAQLHGNQHLFVITAEGLVSLHPETGKVDWTVEHYGRAPMSYNAVSPLVMDDLILVVTGPGPGSVCVRTNPDRTYEILWKNRRVLDSQYNTLIPWRGRVCGFTAAGQGGAEIRCVDMATGELVWKYHSILKRGQALRVGDALLVLGEKGHLASLLCQDDGVKVLSFTREPLMSGPCYCAPALAGDRLILKDEQRLACFDLSFD